MVCLIDRCPRSSGSRKTIDNDTFKFGPKVYRHFAQRRQQWKLRQMKEISYDVTIKAKASIGLGHRVKK